MRRKIIVSFCAAFAGFWVSLLSLFALAINETVGYYVYLGLNFSLRLWSSLFPLDPYDCNTFPSGKAMLASALTTSLFVGVLTFLWLSRPKRINLR